jgi:hypothetical protein
MNLISIKEAAELGIERLRKPGWKDPLDHLKITILRDNTAGPWTHLYSPSNEAVNGRDPVSLLAIIIGYTVKEYLEYTGPLPDSEEYKTNEALFNKLAE